MKIYLVIHGEVDGCSVLAAFLDPDQAKLAAKCAARRGNRSRNRQRWKWLGSLGRQTSSAERWQRLKLDADECARRGILSGWEDEQNMWYVREMKVSGT